MTYIEICEINPHLPLCRCIYVPEYPNLWKLKSACERDQRKTQNSYKLSLVTKNKMKTFFLFQHFQTKYMLVDVYMITMNTFFTRKHHKLNCYTRIIINWTSTNVIQKIMCWTYFTQEDSSYSRFLWNASKTDINNF